MISQLIRQPNVWLVNHRYFVNQNEIADCFSCLMGVLVAESVCQIEESSLCSVPEVGSFGRGIAGTLDCFSSRFLDGCQWLDIIEAHIGSFFNEFENGFSIVFDDIWWVLHCKNNQKPPENLPKIFRVSSCWSGDLEDTSAAGFRQDRTTFRKKKTRNFEDPMDPMDPTGICNLQFHAFVVGS